MSEPHFYDEAALLERLSNGLKRRTNEVIFLVGAPLSTPPRVGAPGVPGVEGIIQLIRSEFQRDAAQLNSLDRDLADGGARRYQAAFTFLQGRRGQTAVNDIVREAVRLARVPESQPITEFPSSGSALDDECRFLEADVLGWVLNPGTEFLGRLAAHYPHRFGKSILTTNFDPLIEIAIRRAGGSYFRTILHADGNIGQTEGTGSHVIHFHGYWYGSDTLHTPRQLGQSRPRLRASLNSILRHKVVVVCAYGGWDDAFTEALMDVVRDDTAYPEIIWTFHDANPRLAKSLSQRLEPGIDRGRVALYSGIDCHQFFPKLYQAWLSIEEPIASSSMQQLSSVYVSPELRAEIERLARQQRILEGHEEDRPPHVEICVGRDDELRSLRDSLAKVVFLTGIGGQGKSTIAASYFIECQKRETFSIFVWRDCKEESERFENQLASVVEKLSAGRITAEDLAKQSVGSVVDILMRLIRNVRVLFVFDNADHYVDLETRMMTGSADAFIEALLDSGSSSRAVFTCRPSVVYDHALALNRHLGGLSLAAALELFTKRRAPSGSTDIEDAYRATEGHAFWLDLLAVQVAKPSASTDLRTLVAEIRSGRGPLPEKTLKSIWATLKDREQLVLRTLGETVKPTSEEEIGDYLRHVLNYGKVVRALTALKALNLIVVKRLPNSPDALELHPLVREFIRQNFTQGERASFIDAIIKVYKRVMGKHKDELSRRPPLVVLINWTQSAELDVAAGRFNEAFAALGEVGQSFRSSAYPREFSRVARLLLSTVDWVREHHRFKAFEEVFSTQIRNLSYFGEYGEAEALLAGYERTVPAKDARYINFCEMKCFFGWVRRDFVSALEWGKAGRSLKETSGVDTQVELEHTLALAERDAGNPEAALPVFLRGSSLADVANPNKLDDAKNGAFYGNIGRCLHFVGQIEPALICYQKSALMLEKKPMLEHTINQGFIRAWIGELLIAREQFKLGAIFLRAAFLKWEGVSPPLANRAVHLLEHVKQRTEHPLDVADDNVEKICLDWIMGSELAANARA